MYVHLYSSSTSTLCASAVMKKASVRAVARTSVKHLKHSQISQIKQMYCETVSLPQQVGSQLKVLTLQFDIIMLPVCSWFPVCSCEDKTVTFKLRTKLIFAAVWALQWGGLTRKCTWKHTCFHTFMFKIYIKHARFYASFYPQLYPNNYL